MHIPSYEDLMPSIPDVLPGDVFSSTAAVLPPSGSALRAAGSAAHQSGHTGLFAALDGAPADRLVAIARDFSPRIEQWPGGRVVLDVAGLQRLLGDAPAIAAQLARAGVPRVAMATSQVTALLLARASAGVTVATGTPDRVLHQVRLDVLHQLAEPGFASAGRVFEILRGWGLTTIGELAALPAADLAARLGGDGMAIQRLARGIDPRPLVPDPAVVRYRRSFELEWPVDTLEPLSFVFARLLDPLVSALERADRGAVAIHLVLRLTDRSSHPRSLQLPASMRDPRVLRTLLLLDLESHPPSAAVDEVSIELDPAPGRITQYSLLERAVPSPETVATLMARLGALVGEGRCGSPVQLDTHQPDGFVMGAFAINESSSSTPNFQRPTPKGSRSNEPGGNRPEARQLSPACEGGGGDPVTTPRPILRRFRPPIAVRVTVEGARPVRVAIDRQGMPGGAVRHAAGPWRTSGAWWRSERWDRDEWDVALSDGAVCRLFLDRDPNQWFMDGALD